MSAAHEAATHGNEKAVTCRVGFVLVDVDVEVLVDVELVHAPHNSGHMPRTLVCSAGNEGKSQYLYNAAFVSAQRSSSGMP